MTQTLNTKKKAGTVIFILLLVVITTRFLYSVKIKESNYEVQQRTMTSSTYNIDIKQPTNDVETIKSKIAFDKNKINEQKFAQPDFNLIHSEPNAKEIIQGKNYLENTAELLPEYVGAKINCTQCHLNAGTTKGAIHWVGIASQFPQYRDRSGKMDTLEDRVNDCFERSLNGKKLPKNSPQMKDIISYMNWLSKGYENGIKIEKSGVKKINISRLPDLVKGQAIYSTKCSSCHQSQGQGLVVDKKIYFPPIWGQHSFNIGAGMARIQTAAGYVKANMPQGQGGTLTDEEAWDVAGYFTQQDRPDFKNKKQDWPKGNKPRDSRY